MDSDPKDEDAATKHVLDYYKKYSQNRDLPKYFSGTSVSYLPEIKDSVSPEVEIRSLVQTDIDIVITAAESNENIEESVATSRPTSPMSSHKLEWDSGADIGYNNCQEKQLRKSLSLPTITDLGQKKSNSDFEPITSNTAVTRSQSSSSDGNVKVVLLTCSSSSEYHSDENNMGSEQLKRKESWSSSSSNRNNEAAVNTVSSSSSNNAQAPNNTNISISSSNSSKKQSLKQFASTLSYLKQKIGLPGAHSTPKCTDEKQGDTDNASSGTPVLKKSASDKDKTEVNTSKSAVKNEEETLHKNVDIGGSKLKKVVTKYQNQKVINLAVTKPITVECTCSGQSIANRSLQTVTKHSTVAVQTDEVTEQELQQIIHNSRTISKNQSLIYFEYSESEKNSARSTQTNSDIVESNCDSFVYLEKQPSEPKDSGLHEIKREELKGIELMLPKQEQTLKRAQKTHDLRTNHSEENSEKSSSTEFCLGNLVSVGLLENVEDDIGKSVYLLQRLLKSKKYDPVTKKRYIKKIIKKITESKYLEESSTSSELFVPKKLPKPDLSGDKKDNGCLQSNVPWYPAGDQPKLAPRRKELVQKTFTQDFLPHERSSKEEVSSAPEIVPVNARDMRKNRFTLTNNEFSVNHKYGCKEGKKLSETDSTSLEKHYESSSTSKSYQNWKDDKTLSEKLFEKHSDGKSHSSNGNGDCFVKFADKERQFQIGWINNEISHLGKLKGFLEKPKIGHKNPSNLKKTTNVYTVFNKNDTPSKPKRNYVIETFIGAHSSSDMNFKLNGQAYTVQEYLNSRKKKEPKRPRQVTGSIEVVTSDSVTNIKVTTFCEVCKRSPCICNLSEHEQSCPCLGKCDSPSCICLKESLAKTSDHGLCQDYCKKLSSSSCDICEKYRLRTEYKEPAKSVTSNSSDISGTFIPIAPARPTVIKYSTFPSTSKEASGRKQNFSLSSQEADIIDQGTSTDLKGVNSQKDQASSYGSLRKVFENCACTQTNCSCDFVEKLMNRFSKTEMPCSTECDNKCQQTDKNEIQSVGLQTRADTKNQNQQTTTLTIDDKSLQTEEYVDKTEHQTVGVQTQVKVQNEGQQTSIDFVDAQTELSKLEGNFHNIRVQTKSDVKDQVLQTTRSLDLQQNNLKNNVGTHTSPKRKTHHKGVSFVDETTSPLVHSASTSPDHVTKQKDASVSPTIRSVSTSLDNVRKRQDATTSPMIRSTNASSGRVRKQKNATTSPKSHSDDQNAVTSQGSGSSGSSSSKSSSSTSDSQNGKVLCVCCCTQTESQPQGKHRGRNVKVQMNRKRTDSDKENGKRKGDSLTTSSATYDICPSILVSSYDTSRSLSDDSSSKPPLVICVCCNERHPADKISVLGSKAENYPLCCNCLTQRPILTSVCYAGPEENCPCSKPPSYRLATSDLSDETKKTGTDSNDPEEYCTCTKPFQFKNSKYCSYCRFKLKNTARSRNGIAYTLTLESDCLNKIRRRRKKIPLEEIRLKVPSPSKRKKHKDKENVSKRDKEDGKKDKEEKKKKTCECTRVVCTRNCHVQGISSKHKMDKNGLTLQEYLQKNRPDFIHSAESRRHVVLNSKSERVIEQNDARLKFAEENMQQLTAKKPRKLFTEQEMKEITKRNYKKLPEVRNKINSKKEQRLRTADRFIVDVFARKIQSSVLKGKSSFPIDSNVMCLPKTCNC